MSSPERRPMPTLLVFLGLCCAFAVAVLEVPARNTFLVREKSAGDYVYVDGGELSQWSVNRVREGIAVESTLSIDISRSWTTSDVSIRSIKKTGPLKSSLVLWTDSQAGEFYSWGGEFPPSVHENITEPELWKFTADGEGGGEWSIVKPANGGAFADIHSGTLAASANTDNTAFVIGGEIQRFSEPDRNGSTQVLGGMVTFNMASRVWTNETDNSPFGTLVGASAHYLPSFGVDGVIITLGGLTPSLVGRWDGKVPALDFYNLTFFNPVTKKTYWQLTSGDIPPSPRIQACTAIIKTADGGYDIFLAGGVNRRDLFTYQDAYVLSLPGFVWRKAPNMPYSARGDATCVQIGGRQVLSLFGKDVWKLTDDPAPNGMLLFDMTDMQWKDSYDAAAGAYERPSVLETWYNNGSFDQVDWSSEEVRRLFARRSTTPPSSTQSSGPSPTGSGGPDPTSTGEPESSSTPVGAIVGGVVGGIGGLALIAVAVWIFLRRRKQGTLVGSIQDNSTDGAGEIKYPGVPEADAPHGHTELSSPRSPVEMDPRGLPVEINNNTPGYYHEADSRVYHEMDPQAQAFEMDPQQRTYEMDASRYGRGY
ncbi:hypothetical protein CHGG_07112 [Chaetomium globosum CBS 148.51]|uniref:Kelch repeat protein n=1 Tax=Chaetomium globosum (strain ATCC 6205 / CBS 148.51 / DSM 1962 / NBRC 6347 / NRRL 1970) TaxID=306901 RepID=Q2GY42_CHAGB|nr:uncharacterized protein CHGG_07112 [Chaetomium globosum CBS 148.51]EAQ85859.1 hypothetical protein CHGG_07112 [Chaetomium globosum CBS 148.51]